MKFLAFGAALALAGCASNVPLATPTGQPEVTIQAESAAKILDATRSFCTQRKATVTPIEPNGVACSAPAEYAIQAIAGVPTTERQEYRVEPTAEGMKLTARMFYERLMMDGSTRSGEMNTRNGNDKAHGLQRNLQEIKATLGQ